MALIKIFFTLLLFGFATSASVSPSNSEEGTMTSTTSKVIHEGQHTKTTAHLHPDYIVSISHWFFIAAVSFLAVLCIVCLCWGIWTLLGRCCRKYDLDRRLYWKFRDSVCCGPCLRRTSCGRGFEYESLDRLPRSRYFTI